MSGGRLAWLRAGQNLLRTGGIAAVKVHALKRVAGLTTGSFYHHFDGIDGFQNELARYWGAEFIESNLPRIDTPDPRERLANISRVASDDRLRGLDAAMRDWAGSNEVAADAVRRTDRILLDLMVDAFAELGFDTADARLRAQLYLSAGVARIMTPWPTERGDAGRVLDVLTR